MLTAEAPKVGRYCLIAKRLAFLTPEGKCTGVITRSGDGFNGEIYGEPVQERCSVAGQAGERTIVEKPTEIAISECREIDVSRVWSGPVPRDSCMSEPE